MFAEARKDWKARRAPSSSMGSPQSCGGREKRHQSGVSSSGAALAARLAATSILRSQGTRDTRAGELLSEESDRPVTPCEGRPTG